MNEDISFPYPTEKGIITEEEENSLKVFGHLEVGRKESVLLKILNQFTTILVSSNKKRDYIASFVAPSKRIGILKKKELKADEHCRYYTMLEENCEE